MHISLSIKLWQKASVFYIGMWFTSHKVQERWRAVTTESREYPLTQPWCQWNLELWIYPDPSYKTHTHNTQYTHVPHHSSGVSGTFPGLWALWRKQPGYEGLCPTSNQSKRCSKADLHSCAWHYQLTNCLNTHTHTQPVSAPWPSVCLHWANLNS